MMETGLEMVSMLGEVERKSKLELDETELRLGLPCGGGGGGGEENVINANGKRSLKSLDLKLNLASKDEAGRNLNKNLQNEPVEPPLKAQVVGWPPVPSFRKNILAVVQKSSSFLEESTEKVVSTAAGAGNAAILVKVIMDGAPYLRKVDLKMYSNYRELSHALSNMFHSFTIGKCESQGMMDFMNDSKLIDLLNSSDYVPTYEDKDGDWMLVGDVPWEMFVESCKRLRIMKGAEAIGLAPRALAKCKNIQKLNM